ncbi:MAG TPA: hypothetical protein VMT42_00235 [candidate division Zixibacteria bacterium]|nr:hypothetical protein [candidate division Zixibacteria bacterium]
MTIFLVDTYVIKPDKLGEFAEFVKKYFEWMKKRTDLANEVKSHKLFSHMIGKFGGYVEMIEFENLADFEKWTSKIMRSEFMTTIYPEFAKYIVPGTESNEIWNSIM